MVMSQSDFIEAAEAVRIALEWSERRSKVIQRAQNQYSALFDLINPESLVAVHLTDHFPKHGKIKSRGSVFKKKSSQLDWFPRETIHFCLNGPVGSHMLNSWDGKKFAIIIPFKAMIPRIYNLAPQDTFVVGDFVLPYGTEVLGKHDDLPKRASATIKLIPIADIEKIEAAVMRRVEEKGLPPAVINAHNWSFADMKNASRMILREAGRNIDLTWNFGEIAKSAFWKSEQHNHSLFGEVEEVSKIFSNLLQREDFSYNSSVNRTDFFSALKKRLKKVQREIKKFLLSLKGSFQREFVDALKRIDDFLKHLEGELPSLKRFHADMGELAIISDLRRANELSDVEKRWLVRENQIIEEIGESFMRGVKTSFRAELSNLQRTERRVYQKFQELDGRLVDISQVKSLLMINGLREKLRVQEAFLVKQVPAVITQFRKKELNLDKNHAGKLLEHTSYYLKSALAALEEREQALQSRLSFDEKRKAASHWQ